MKMRNASDTRFYFELAIFNSFKEDVVIKNITTPIKTVTPKTIPTAPKVIPNPETTKASITLPPLDQVFKITPLQFSDNNVPKTENVKLTKVVDSNTIFNQIAYNNNKKSLEHAKQFLEKIKEEVPNKILSFLLPAIRVLVASTGGIVLLFEDEIDAELLNAKNNTYDFLIEIKKYFNEPIYVLGLSKENGKKWANDFMKLKKQGDSFAEPDLMPLKEITKANNSIDQVAFEIFGDQ
jgi:hypothetical protein